MTDEEFLALDAEAARLHLRTMPRLERFRLGKLYETRRSSEILEDHSDSQTFATTGLVIAAAGVCLGLWALFFDVSGGSVGYRDIANIDLIGIRQVLATLASGLFVGGLVLLGSAQIVRAISR